MATKTWGDKSVLESIPNPDKRKYTIETTCPEITLIGHKDQPDFGCIKLTMSPKDKVIELKSLKKYFYSFRNEFISYERFINVVYDDIMEIYDPIELELAVEFNPRGGLSSNLVVKSSWR